MNIEITIKAPELVEALNNIAISLSAVANLSGPATSEHIPSTIEEKKLSPSDEKKKELSEKIMALGGNPPEKGSVAKFESMLGNLERAEEDKAEEDKAEEKPEAEAEEISVDDVRTLAHAVINSSPEKGKMALQGILKLHKAKNLTSATQKQLQKIVPELEKYLGKTLAEVLAEADD